MGVVDASIGIKTAVNFLGKNNKLGTYCPPLAVFTDIAFMRTLDARNLANGSAEIIKMACVKDAPLFQLLEAHAATLMATHYQVCGTMTLVQLKIDCQPHASGHIQPSACANVCRSCVPRQGSQVANARQICVQGPTASAVIRRSIQGMLEELEYNLHEHILSRLVDYGHTFSMEIEMAGLADGMLHGEAVSIDMAVTTQLAAARGLLPFADADRVFRVMEAFRYASTPLRTSPEKVRSHVFVRSFVVLLHRSCAGACIKRPTMRHELIMRSKHCILVPSTTVRLLSTQ
jgi:2-epi-5-epi-valiolone synthase